jgi:hypothetical protein
MAKRDPKAENLPSIVNGVYLRTSASQIETHLMCPLKWHSDKVQHLPRKEPSKGQKLGEKGHKEIEHLIDTGEDVRGVLALAGRHLIDPYLVRAPSADFPFALAPIEAENGIQAEARYPGMVTPAGVEFVGYIDVTVPPAPAGTPAPNVPHPPDPTQPEIIDHKFRSNLELYGATEEDLLTDTQGIVYGKHALIRWPSADVVRFSHHQHQHTGRRYANRVSVVLPREHIEREFARIVAHVDGPMREHAAITDPARVPWNPNPAASCNAFGGCDFKKTCPHSPNNLWLAGLTDDAASAVPLNNKDEKAMGLLDKMNTTPATAPAAAPTNPTPPPPPAAVAGGIAAKAGTLGKRYTLPGGKVGEFQAVAGTRVFFTDSAGAPITCGADDQIVPVAEAPAAPAAPTAPVLPPGAVAAKDAKQGQFYSVRGVLSLFLCMTSGQASFVPTAGGAPVLLPPDEPVFPAAAPASTPAPAAQASAPVLPPDAPASTPGAVATKQEAPDEEEDDEDDNAEGNGGTAPAGTEAKPRRGRKPKAQAAAEVAASAPVGGDALILIVGGFALSSNGAPSRDLAPYVADLAAKAASAAGVPDVRMAPKDSPLAFGGWKGALAAAARQNPPKGICHVAPGDLADAVIEGLAPLASMTIRHTR